MKIALLSGGTSAEREIALLSAKNVCDALERFCSVEQFDFPNQVTDFVARYKEFDCAVPVFHGRGGEDGVVQGFLETLGVPYIFSGVMAHATSMHKAVTKDIVCMNDICVPAGQLLGPGEGHTFSEPVVVKPPDGGSSLATSLVFNQEEMDASIKAAQAHSTHVLVEQLIEGREFTVPIIDTPDGLKALPVIEICSKNAFFDYESKYDASRVEEICPAQIDEELTERLQEVALKAHKLLAARHISRTDMIVDAQGQIWFLEINTIPGLTNESLVPKALRATNIELADVLRYWIHDVV